MKTKQLLIAAAMLFMTIGTQAQPPAPLDVVPGSKGQLPIDQIPQLGQLQDKHIAGLLFQFTTYDYNSYFESYSLRAVLTIQEPGILEADSYTLQYRAHSGDGEWTTFEADSYTEGRGYGYDYGFELKEFPFDVTDWRVVINGGPRDGYVSNTATVRLPGASGMLFTKRNGWNMDGSDFNDNPKLVGSEYGSGTSLTTVTHRFGEGSSQDVDYTANDGFYRYQWYRIDPVTYEETAIEGATDSVYTPTFADAGYILAKEFRGDDVHCSFYYRFVYGEVALPVIAGFEYIGNDGFVLNTDYIVPNPQTSFVYDLEYYWNEDGTVPESGRLPDGSVSERKPGQYVFRMNEEDFNYMTFTLSIPGTALKVCYMMEQWDENWENIIGYEPWYREVQVMADRFMQPMVVTPKFGGALLPTVVDVIGKNIDGEDIVLATETLAADATEGITFEAVTTLGGGVYLKAHATETTATTYYPNALTMAQATPVVPGVDEEWNPLEFVIDLQPAGATPPAEEGDVNGDGDVGIGDIVAITNVMAGINADEATKAVADVNGDGEVGIGDIVAITNIMAGVKK